MYGKVSVIIPVYNRQNTVEECLRSILAQTYSNFEAILIDDGSSDQTIDICRRMTQEDPRIRLLERQHGGVSAARNAGIDAAEGDFLLFVDSDDVIHPQLIQTLASEMAATGAAVGACRTCSVPQARWSAAVAALSSPSSSPRTEHRTFDRTLRALLVNSPFFRVMGSFMLRREFLGTTRFRTDLFIGEDFFFIYENLIKGSDALLLDEDWYLLRLHKGNSSWNYNFEAFYSRFLRRKLVWESEEHFGRTEFANIQKRDAVWVFSHCSSQPSVSKNDRKHMCQTMKLHRRALFPALSVRHKLHFLASIYVPNLYLTLMSAKTKLSRRKAKGGTE